MATQFNRPTRILPSVVKKAYKIAGVKPITNYIAPIDGTGNCCGLGAVCTALGIPQYGTERRSILHEYFKINESYGYLFLEGMQEMKRPEYSIDANHEFSFCKSSEYDLFAVMWCIASQVGARGSDA
jgi:hypothetical protein